MGAHSTLRWRIIRKAFAVGVALLILPGLLLVFAQLVQSQPRLLLRPRDGCSQLAFLPDNKCLVTLGRGGKFGTGSTVLQVWDASTGGELLCLESSREVA